jgi:hypothetical protein
LVMGVCVDGERTSDQDDFENEAYNPCRQVSGGR